MSFHIEHATNCCVISQDSLLRDNLSRWHYTQNMKSDIDKERGVRLTTARKKAGYEHASEFARKNGIGDEIYRAYERGTRTVSYERALILGNKLGVDAEWIYSGNVLKNNIASVPIVGKMKGGIITASHPLIGSPEVQSDTLLRLPTAEVPPEMNASLLFAVEVMDSHFAPYIEAGAKIYYNRSPDSPDSCIGKLCVIQIQSGATVCDVLTRGSKAGLYDTQYHGRDLEIEWCAKRRFTKDV